MNPLEHLCRERAFWRLDIKRANRAQNLSIHPYRNRQHGMNTYRQSSLLRLAAFDLNVFAIEKRRSCFDGRAMP